MCGYLHIQKIFLDRVHIETAYDHMRRVGQEGFEGVALFAGNEYDKSFSVTKAIIPKQTAVSLEYGLLYSVDGSELHRLNMYLYENNLSLIAQIHSHPDLAFHSETDDAYPIITTVGGFSIVVPFFASMPFDLEDWAVYRLDQDSRWQKLSMIQKSEIFFIT